MEILFEILFEIVFEAVGEALIDASWRGADGATRDALGLAPPSTARRVAGLVLTMIVAAGFGLWRGLVVGELGWGWWFALAVTVVATCGALLRLRHPAGPRPARRAALRWWPAPRLAWFAAANAAFVVAYAIGQAADAAPA